MRYQTYARMPESEREHFVVYLTDAHTNSSAELVLSVGFNLNALMIDGESIIQGTPELRVLRARSSEFGSALLTPPNYLRGGTFVFERRTYRFPTESDGHHLHGELRSLPWNLIGLGFDDHKGAYASAEFALSEHPSVYGYYPHDLVYRLTYALKDGVLSVESTVKNRGEEPAPFGLGFHPYIGFGEADDADSVIVRLPAALQYEIGTDLFPSGAMAMTDLCIRLRQGITVGELPSSPLFSLFKLTEGAEAASVIRRGANIAVNLRLQSGFPFLALFKPPWANAISLEPYSCIANAFNSNLEEERKGITRLEAGESKVFRWSIELETGE